MRIVLSFTAALLITFTTACNNTTDRATATRTSEGGSSSAPAGTVAEDRGKALVRFVNVDPTLDKADLWFGDHKAFSGIQYKAVTSYVELPRDQKSFLLRAEGQGVDLASNTEALMGGNRYTVIAMRKSDNSSVLYAVGDNIKPAEDGKARVRFVNAATRAGELDLLTSGNKDEVFDEVNFGNTTDFKDVPAGPGYEVRSEDQKTAGVRVNNKSLEAGKSYTVIALGDGKLDTLFIEDELLHQVGELR